MDRQKDGRGREERKNTAKQLSRKLFLFPIKYKVCFLSILLTFSYKQIRGIVAF